MARNLNDDSYDIGSENNDQSLQQVHENYNPMMNHGTSGYGQKQQENEGNHQRLEVLAHEKNEDKLEHDENMRFLGNGMPISDPNLPPYSPFYLMVTGAIESGTMNDKDGVSCQFNFTSGTDWHIHSVSRLFILIFCSG